MILAVILIAQLLSSVAYAEPFFPAQIQNRLSNTIVLYKDSPHAYVNNCEVLIDPNDKNAAPEIIGGRTLIPLRFMCDSLKASLIFDKTSGNIFVSSGNTKIKIRINESKIEINGKKSSMDFPACIIHKRVYVPLKSITPAFGKKLFYYKGLIFISDSSTIFNTVTEKKSLDTIIQFFNENHDVQIPILMYHNFDYNITPDLLSTTITPDEFEQHIKYLTSNGYTGITFSDLYNYIQGREKLPVKPFIITMDDGYYTNYSSAYPILKKYNTPGTIFISTSFMGQHPGMNPHFTWEQAKEMEDSGIIEIQNHSRYHGRHDTMNYNDLVESVMNAQKMIDDKLGERQVKVFAYPGGRFNDFTRKVIKQLGFDMQMTSLNGTASRYSDMSNINRISIQHGMTGKDVVNKIKLQKAKNIISKITNIDY